MEEKKRWCPLEEENWMRRTWRWKRRRKSASRWRIKEEVAVEEQEKIKEKDYSKSNIKLVV